MAFDVKKWRDAGVPADLIAILVDVNRAAARIPSKGDKGVGIASLVADAENGGIVITLTDGSTTRVTGLTANLSQADQDAIASALSEMSAVLNQAAGFAEQAGAAASAGIEAALDDLNLTFDDTELRALIAQLSARVDALGGEVVNRPPTSSAIPVQALTLGIAYEADFSGYFDDPDGDALDAMDVTGTPPPGIVQDGFVFAGMPTTMGNYTITLTAVDFYGAQVSRTIAWAVGAAATGPSRSAQAEPGGYSLQNPGTLTEMTTVPAIGGYTLEII